MNVQTLSGTRVFDLGPILAGPIAAQMLADLGAEVIIRFSATLISRYREPSVFGEHTDEILSARLGFDEAGIATLRQARVV